MFQRLWVRIPAAYTGRTFITFICCKNCDVCLKRQKYAKKRKGVAQFKKAHSDDLFHSCVLWTVALESK